METDKLLAALLCAAIITLVFVVLWVAGQRKKLRKRPRETFSEASRRAS